VTGTLSRAERQRASAKASSHQRQVPVRCSGAVLLRAWRNGGSYTSQISAAKGARPRDGSPSTPATQLAQQTRSATPLVPSFWPPQPPSAESSSAQLKCKIFQFTSYNSILFNSKVTKWPAFNAHQPPRARKSVARASNPTRFAFLPPPRCRQRRADSSWHWRRWSRWMVGQLTPTAH
jgi:hypothetical protein